MAYFVVNGSQIRCSMACSLPPGVPVPKAPSYPPSTIFSSLIVLPTNKVISGNQPVATVSVGDSQIIPFQLSCMSQSNPTVISASATATAAAAGAPMFVPAPCTPIPAGPQWNPGCQKCRIARKFALNNSSKLNCTMGGTIEIIQTSAMRAKIP